MTFGMSNQADPERQEALARVKRWLRGALELPDEVTVFVSEVACRDAACPDVETVVAVFEPARTRRHTFAKPVHAVTWADVIHLANCWCPLANGASSGEDDQVTR